MKLTNLIGPALLGTCLYGAVVNSFPTNEEKDAVGEIDATNEVERAGCAAALGLKTTIGLTQGEVVAAIRGVGGESVVGRVDVENVENGRGNGAMGHRALPGGRPQWGIRGAWDDDYFQAFAADWVFPFGTNHLAGVVVYSQGGLAASSYDEPFVSLPIPVAIVPREGSFTVEQTSASTVFAWWNVRPGRTATETLDAQIELFRNGDYCVSTNGVVVERFVRENPFPFAPVGQDDWYRAWVDEMVGVGLTNGLYKFTASFPVDPPEATLLTVGEESVVVTEAGEYVFLLEKGEDYELDLEPFSSAVSFEAVDDIPSVVSPLMLSVGTGWWTDWTIGGGDLVLTVPSFTRPGHCRWMPTFQADPSISHLGPGNSPQVFRAVLTDYAYSRSVEYAWSSDDWNVGFSDPHSEETSISIYQMPRWRSSSVRVTATLGRHTLESACSFTYGESETPQVTLSLSAPNALLLNSNKVDSAKIGQVDVSFVPDIETNGTLVLYCVMGEDRVRLIGTCSKVVSGENSFSAGIEGINVSEAMNDVTLCAMFTPSDGGEPLVTQSALTVVQVKDIVLPGAPADGLVVSTGTSVAFDLDVLPVGAASLLSVVYNVRRLRANGTYTEWEYAAGNYRGTDAIYNPPLGGVYQLRAQIGFDGVASEERVYCWDHTEEREISVKKIGDVRAFGVCDSQWQRDLIETAKQYLGDASYGIEAVCPSYGPYSSVGEGSFKCNIFVAHRLFDCGIGVEPVHHGRYGMMRWPPLANEWGRSSFVIAGWGVLSPLDYIQPGMIAIKPSSGPHGHIGIVDCDGMVVSAQNNLVTRKSDLTNWSAIVVRTRNVGGGE